MSGIGRRHAVSHQQCSVSVGLTRRLIGEALGSAFLLAAVVGSGIMADRLFAHEGLALLANSLATGAVLVMLIYTFGPVPSQRSETQWVRRHPRITRLGSARVEFRP